MMKHLCKNQVKSNNSKIKMQSIDLQKQTQRSDNFLKDK
ncbi:unnamed protein product [Paramecium pentaurelia]|uniref:Uncharacterized protein n=1 Tax=Paramecium pentaurelia TaxID=43138 RepID=A0A8S1X7E6_9CILI|nr:unnamed protein product [Paramecium pentaurelia]